MRHTVCKHAQLVLEVRSWSVAFVTSFIMEELETSDAAAVALEAEKQQQNSSLSEESEIRNNEVQQQSSSQSKNSGRFSAFVTKYRVVQRLKKLSNGASIFQERPPGNCHKKSIFY